MVAVMQKCKHFATFAENNDTAGRGRCERFRSSACARRTCVRGRARQRHRRERKENDGGEMRKRASRVRRNWRDEARIISGCSVAGNTSCLNERRTGRPAKRAPFCQAAAVALRAVRLRSVTTDVQVKTVGWVSVTLLNMRGWFKITSSNFFAAPRTSEKHHTSVFVLS